jgi:hypothetical protein
MLLSNPKEPLNPSARLHSAQILPFLCRFTPPIKPPPRSRV